MAGPQMVNSQAVPGGRASDTQGRSPEEPSSDWEKSARPERGCGRMEARPAPQSWMPLQTSPRSQVCFDSMRTADSAVRIKRNQDALWSLD